MTEAPRPTAAEFKEALDALVYEWVHVRQADRRAVIAAMAGLIAALVSST